MKSSSTSAASSHPAASCGGRRAHYTLRFLLRGLVVLAPITITVAIMYWFFALVDGLFSPYIESPGLGLLVAVSLIFLVGWISFFPVSQRIFGHFNVWMEKPPGVGFIYTSARDFMEAFAGDKRRFSHAVLVNIHAEEVWLVGFLTDEDLGGFKLGAKYVSVYVPQAYNFAGQLYLVKRENVRPIEHLAPADVMKYAVTGGAAELITGRKWGQAVTCYFLRANKEAVADETRQGMAYIVVFGSGNGVNRSSHSGRDVSHVALRAEEPDGVRPSMVVFYRPSFATNGVRQLLSSRELSLVF